MASYFISDTHFGHGNIMRHCCRPFLNENELKMALAGGQFAVSAESIKKMDDAMLDNINTVVGKNDMLYHLGDFAWKNPGEYRERINCKNVVLILGNHDDPQKVRSLFTEVHDELLVTVEQQKILLKHYPLLSWDGSYRGVWHAFGHVHGRMGYDPDFALVWERIRSIDVGVDGPYERSDGPMSGHRFRPWSMAEIRQFMTLKLGQPHM